MKKAVEITNVTIENGTATVTYITGTVRKYPEDNLPKTVQSWMEAHREEAAEEPSYKEEAPGVITVTTIQEPAQLPAVVEVTSKLLQTNFKEDEAEDEADEETTFIEPKASILSKMADLSIILIEGVAKATKAAVMTAGPVILKGILTGAPVLMSILIKVGMILADLVMALAFWIPELATRAVRRVWVVWPTVATTTIILTGRTVRRAGAVAKATASTIRAGWQMREEILAEQAA